MLVLNVYLNPTSDMKANNRRIINKFSDAIDMAIVNNAKIVAGGDLNDYKNEIRSFCTSRGLCVSKVGSTRVNGNSEIDMIATNLKDPNFCTSYEPS